MQVTHATDHITHALIGGSNTIEFGISNSIAFFQILSSTLYSDQKLAVAREVLCNAWDAHIRAGLTDTPVRVTITTDKIIVHDSAVGIAPDMMGPLYGTYGGSDKTNNGQETGGFGLGCKAPFAYTDHFEVISCFEGTKTIYNVSKSSVDKLGKPGITPIVSLPTAETGLTVTIPLKFPVDRHTFIRLFTKIAFNGEMNVEINGTLVDTLPMSKSEFNWIITHETVATGNDDHQIFVRYGNVIYPIEHNAAYASDYQNVREFLRSLPVRYGNSSYSIVFQALPDTISVTPSRESLSMQEHTIETLGGLLKGFFKGNLLEKIAEQSEPVLEARIKTAIEEQRVAELISNERNFGGRRDGFTNIQYITTLNDLTEQYLLRNYPKGEVFYQKDMKLRIQGAITIGAGPRGHLEQIYHLEYEPIKKKELKFSNRSYTSTTYWFKRKVLRKLYGDIHCSKVVELSRLHIMDGEGNYGKPRLTSPKELYKNSLSEYLPVMRKVLILTYSQVGLWQTIRGNAQISKLGGPIDTWLYHAPFAKSKIQAIRDFFVAHGFTVVDFTQKEAHDAIKPDRVKRTVVAKPKLDGSPSLLGVKLAGKEVRADNCFVEGQPRVIVPKLYLKVIFSKADSNPLSIGHFSNKASKLIVKLFGAECAVVRTDPAEKKMKEAGLPALNEYVVAYVRTKVSTDQAFLDYWPQDLSRTLHKTNGQVPNLHSDESHRLAAYLFDIPEIRTKMGLTTSLNEHDRMVLELWRDMLNNWHYYSSNSYPELKSQTQHDVVSGLSISQEILDIGNKVKNSKLLDTLDSMKVQKIVRNSASNPNGQLALLAQLTQTVLLG